MQRRKYLQMIEQVILNLYGVSAFHYRGYFVAHFGEHLILDFVMYVFGADAHLICIVRYGFRLILRHLKYISIFLASIN